MLSKLEWLKLKKETRQAIANFLGMTRSGGTDVVDGRVACDGYLDSDLAKVTLELLQEKFSSTNTNFYELFKEMVRRIENPPINLQVEREIKTVEEKMPEKEEVKSNKLKK
jgi:hypothetical protein